MESEEFRKRGYEMVDYIVNYLDTIEERRVLSAVKPNYLRPLLPDSAPEEGEGFDKIMEDVERLIMPGVTHWRSPYFMAYFPAAGSYPSYLADMLCGALGCVGFSWINSPACTELESVMMDWLGKACGLPEQFLFVDSSNKPQNGGGVIQGSASEATLVTMLSARAKAMARGLEELGGSETPASVLGRLVAYTSEQAHQSVNKASVIAAVKLRTVCCADTETFRLTGSDLESTIEEDKRNGLIPFWVCATVGTTSSGAVDDLRSIGALCQRHGLWLHVDAAYAGSATVCPEHRGMLDGLELADSYGFNPHKCLLVNFDCAALWVRDRHALTSTFKIDAAYLKNNASDSGLVVDYKDWQIPLGRRFRALKLWFVMRCYGTRGLQEHIRQQCRLAKEFLALVQADVRFEIATPPLLGLVCFRLKGSDEANRRLHEAIIADGQVFLSSTTLGGRYVLRAVVCSTAMESTHVQKVWQLVVDKAAAIAK